MVIKGKKLEDKHWLDDQEKAERLAVLLIREIDRVVFDLELRRELLFTLFSRERIRTPLLRVLSSRYYEIKAELLILLPSDVYQMVDDFYRELDEFIFYVSYTEDMPLNLQQKFDAYLEDIKRMAPALIDKLQTLVTTGEVELAAFEPELPDLDALPPDTAEDDRPSET